MKTVFGDCCKCGKMTKIPACLHRGDKDRQNTAPSLSEVFELSRLRFEMVSNRNRERNDMEIGTSRSVGKAVSVAKQVSRSTHTVTTKLATKKL